MPVNALRQDHIDAALPVERLAEVLTRLAHGLEVQPNGGGAADLDPGAASAPRRGGTSRLAPPPTSRSRS